MIKRLIYICIPILGLMIMSSCEKCRTCQCWKDGVEYEEKNCAYGGGSSNETQKTWEKYLTDEEGYDYDSVRCYTE